jgi:hypothetical protein
MSPASHLVQILLPTRKGPGQPVTQARFEELLHRIDGQVRERDQLRPRARAGVFGTAAEMWSGTISR